MVQRVGIRCGHCDGEHETVDDVRACAEQHRHHPEPATAGPMHCGRPMIPIVYGYPSLGMHDRAARGEIRIGGCMVGAFMADWECPVCGHVAMNPKGHRVDGLATVNMDRAFDWDRVPDPPWWTKIRMRLEYWITGDV